MTFQFSLQKVLNLKKNEKNLLEVEYSNAYLAFEKIGESLYRLLKQKERIQARNAEKMAEGTAMNDIQTYQLTFESLQSKIHEYEMLYQKAREDMQQRKEILTEKSIDVKRYEKLRDNQYEQFRLRNKAIEASSLDEISTIHYVTQ